MKKEELSKLSDRDRQLYERAISGTFPALFWQTWVNYRDMAESNTLRDFFQERANLAYQPFATWPNREINSKQETTVTIANYVLCTGQLLNVTTKSIQGMAGENVDIVSMEVGGLKVQLDFVKSLMKAEDANDLEEYLNDVDYSNEQLAISFCN